MTPNLYEAQLLTGITIAGSDDAKRAARELARRGPRAVIVTGGHLDPDTGMEDITQDICYMEGRFYEIEGRRYPGEYHGTGCFFSSALASFLALGQTVMEAAMNAKKLTTDAIRKAFHPGKGMGILRA
jgi:hydroxymethylpyrimidine/phosphomethylpyrimidine kinase